MERGRRERRQRLHGGVGGVAGRRQRLELREPRRQRRRRRAICGEDPDLRIVTRRTSARRGGVGGRARARARPAVWSSSRRAGCRTPAAPRSALCIPASRCPTPEAARNRLGRRVAEVAHAEPAGGGAPRRAPAASGDDGCVGWGGLGAGGAASRWDSSRPSPVAPAPEPRGRLRAQRLGARHAVGRGGAGFIEARVEAYGWRRFRGGGASPRCCGGRRRAPS